MKKIPFLLMTSILLAGKPLAIAQPQIEYFPNTKTRHQQINQFTDVFISSPVDNQILGDVAANFPFPGATINHYFEFDSTLYTLGYYREISLMDAAATVMEPGKAYVLQWGGAPGEIGDFRLGNCIQDYSSGGDDNVEDITVDMLNGRFNLIGNPYLGFLDADAFLLDADNADKVTGPIRLWGHNTLVSEANVNPLDSNAFRFSANDFALYNVMGGVAAGRWINISDENQTYTGVETPNGILGFGTGFLIKGIADDVVTFKESMIAPNNGGADQSFRNIANPTADRNNNQTESLPPPPPEKSRIWVNLEQGTIPTLGTNTNQLKQLLVGYTQCFGSECATDDDDDRVFDAEVVTAQSAPKIEFYSLKDDVSTKQLAIQGRNVADFAATDFFQLGFKVTDAGSYTFTATSDGIFGPGIKDYYISDNGVLHDFPYTVTFSANESSDARFRIVFGERAITLKLFIEGYYNSSSDQMVPVMVNQNTSINPADVGLIDVAIMNGTTQVEEIQGVMLHVDGTTGLIPYANTTPTGLYRIRVRHRNTIETWSSETNLVQIGGSASYDFSNAANKAYGSNQIEVESGVWAFYSGDVNQDENIENTDFTILEADITNSEFGDRPTDLNGDGVVDNSDSDFVVNNANNFIYSQQP